MDIVHKKEEMNTTIESTCKDILKATLNDNVLTDSDKGGR